MGAHQQGDRLIIVVELGFHARQIVKRIHIIRAFTERGLKHPLGALVVASVKGGKAQVIEDVEVRGVLIEGARQGLLRLRVLFPSASTIPTEKVTRGSPWPCCSTLPSRLSASAVFPSAWSALASSSSMEGSRLISSGSASR